MQEIESLGERMERLLAIPAPEAGRVSAGRSRRRP